MTIRRRTCRPCRLPGARRCEHRVVSYTRLPSVDRRGRALAHRRAWLGGAVAGWPECVLLAGYADVGVAGRADRPGLARLLGDAASSRFDAVVVNDLDRLDTDPRRLDVVLGRLAADDVAVWPLLGAGRRPAGWRSRSLSCSAADPTAHFSSAQGLPHGYSTTEVAV